MSSTFTLPTRQIHLDFHTSPFIPDLLTEFDAKEFARTLKAAHVNSATIFAKCHHGMSYYPTHVGVTHPGLNGRDLLGEQMEALRREGIRCPIYTTVAWEEDVAQKHPEWRMMKSTGHFIDVVTATDLKTKQCGGWRFLTFTHPDYLDYIEAHIQELLNRYEVDGFFFDILFMPQGACFNEASIKLREKHGLMSDDLATNRRFEALAQSLFAERFTKLVRGKFPKARLFYNGQTDLSVESSIGPRVRDAHQTHWEIESLPSGFWGYQHFHRVVRGVGLWGKPFLSMTGRFQRQWGDFGGIKPQPALEFETFRSQAFGGANSVGDQLPPRGTLDPAAYDLIGAVFAQIEQAEPFYEGSTALPPQIGLLPSFAPSANLDTAGKADEGVILMCEEEHYDSAILDEESDLSQLELIILNDHTVVTPKLRAKLEAYYKAGGKLILSYRAGRDEKGIWQLDFLPLTFHGEVDKFPSYWRATKEFWPESSKSDRCFYQGGLNVKGGAGTRTLVDRVLPYFRRTDLKFSSHFQTPPQAEADLYPAVIAGERFVYFADPLFHEYREYGTVFLRQVWHRCVKNLIGSAPFGQGLPTSVLLIPRRRGNDLLLSILHYIPVRKCMEIDVIEERQSLYGEKLRLPAKATTAQVYGSKEPLPRDAEGNFILPQAKGRLLIEVPGYFA